MSVASRATPETFVATPNTLDVHVMHSIVSLLDVACYWTRHVEVCCRALHGSGGVWWRG
jgi:hypothetical protein